MKNTVRTYKPSCFNIQLLKARRPLPLKKKVNGEDQSQYAQPQRRQVHTVHQVPVEVVYAVYLRGGVHGEGHAVQTAVTHHAREAARVVGLPHGPQDAIQDGLGAL